MPIKPDALLAHDFEHIRQHYAERDAILYALGLGLGGDPLSVDDLPFLDERALDVLPSFAVTLASPGMWIRAPHFGIDFGKLVHVSHMAWFENPLPPSAGVVGQANVLSLTDRGAGKGALLTLERTISNSENGTAYCRLHQTLLLRGDGGFGGQPASAEASCIPARPADAITEIHTSPRTALIYRLSGDWNPLHLDPAIAHAAGFERPILQGLASYGIAGVAVSRATTRAPMDITELGCRFSGVVMPGDRLTCHIWHSAENRAVFQAFVGDKKVLDQGQISWRHTS